MKKLISLLLVFVMMFSMVACATEEAPATETEAPATEETTDATEEATEPEVEGLGYKIGIVTGTVSQGEEEFRAAEAVKEKYGDDIILQTYPDKFMDEQETTISNILSIAIDPEVKAIVIVQAVPGTSAAIDKARELRDDLIFIVGVPGEDPDMIASKADIVLQADELGMGTAIVEQAEKMGAETFVHYSFPRHMSYQLLSMRRDIFKEECEARGITFVDATAPDPTGDAGVPGAQQFILEDVPRKIEEYGVNTNFFSTNCSMQEPLLKAALEGGAIVAQQCCPSPYHGLPGALGIEIPDEEKGNLDFVIAEVSAKIAAKGGTGRFSTWPVPVNMMFVESGVEYARAVVEGNTNGTVDKEALTEILADYAGVDIQVSTFTNEETGKVHDNFFMILSGYIEF